MTATKYSHKLTRETLTAIKNDSITHEGEKISGVRFSNEKGEERFLSNHQIKRLLK
jgi:hypothetical protein